MKAIDLFPFHSEVREGTLAAVRDLTPEQLEWKPPGGVNNIAGLLRHLAQAEDWFIRRVVQGETMTPKRRSELPDLAALLAYLEETRGRTLSLLWEWEAERLAETRELPPQEFKGRPRGPVSLHWIFNNLFFHEAHHRGQIYLYLRLMGLEPPMY